MELEALVRDAAKGDEHAWRQLTARLTPPLRSFFASRWSGLDCKDLVQETLLIVWNKLPTFEMRSERAFSSWVRRIAQNIALTALRKSAHDEKLVRALAWIEQRPATRLTSRLDRKRRIERLGRELDKLAPSYRQAVENMLDGGDSRDLAKRAGIRLGTARVLEHRTRLLLRHRLGRTTPTPK